MRIGRRSGFRWRSASLACRTSSDVICSKSLVRSVSEGEKAMRMAISSPVPGPCRPGVPRGPSRRESGRGPFARLALAHARRGEQGLQGLVPPQRIPPEEAKGAVEDGALLRGGDQGAVQRPVELAPLGGVDGPQSTRGGQGVTRPHRHPGRAQHAHEMGNVVGELAGRTDGLVGHAMGCTSYVNGGAEQPGRPLGRRPAVVQLPRGAKSQRP